MNFLAHLALSCERDELMLGNFLGDFLSNQEVAALPPRVAAGVMLHRKIDTYTDNHPIIKQGVARLRLRHGKYAPVVIDVFYDYILTQKWPELPFRPFDEFCELAYQILTKNLDTMPLWLQPQVKDMTRARWLRQYGSKAGIEDTFNRMRYRVTRPDLLDGVGESLLEEQPYLSHEFDAFFPEVLAYVEQECANLQSES